MTIREETEAFYKFVRETFDAEYDELNANCRMMAETMWKAKRIEERAGEKNELDRK